MGFYFCHIETIYEYVYIHIEMNKFIETILEKKNNETDDGKWQIVFSDNTRHFMPCICGHKVKRITYIYHRPTKTVGYIGKTCVKKYGIQTKVSNAILLAVIKGHTDELCIQIEDLVRLHILEKYNIFMTKIQEYIHEDIEIDYYDIVAPFRRLLNDVCDLVSEYEYDLVDLLREIERGVESMNQTTKHTMVDEVDSSMESLSYIVDISISDSGIETHDEPLGEPSVEPSGEPSDKHFEETNEICENVLEKIIDVIKMGDNINLTNNDDVRSEISIGSFHEVVDTCQEEPVGQIDVIHEPDEMYEDDFEEEPNDEIEEENPKEYSIDSTGQTQEEQKQKDPEEQKESFDINQKPDQCCCMPQCYCVFKYRLWNMKQELNKHRETLEHIQKETTILVKNTAIFREKMLKSLE